MAYENHSNVGGFVWIYEKTVTLQCNAASINCLVLLLWSHFYCEAAKSSIGSSFLLLKDFRFSGKLVSKCNYIFWHGTLKNILNLPENLIWKQSAVIYLLVWIKKNVHNLPSFSPKFASKFRWAIFVLFNFQ